MMRCYGTFQVGNERFAVEIQRVQEVIAGGEITPVPHAPRLIIGLTKLRGKIVTLVHLPHDQDSTLIEDQPFIILRDDFDLIGLRVDCVHDISELDSKSIQSPPSHLPAEYRLFIEGIYTDQDALYRIVDVPRFTASLAEFNR